MGCFQKYALAVCLSALVPPSAYAEEVEADSFIVHFEHGGRFAVSTPTVSRWLRSDVAVVRPTARRIAGGSATLATEMADWRKLPGVRLVEPDALGKFDTLADAPAPNDPLYASETWLNLVGARGLWALGTGRGVTVAVIDSGVDLSHPDLQANLLAGFNYADGNNRAQDVIGHGTFVAGLLAAVANNGIGVSGLAPGVKIVPFKTSPGNSYEPPSSVVAQSIDQAVAQGVDIINLSLTITTETEVVRQAVQRAHDSGVIVVAAAGNDGIAVGFPANMPGVVAVANSQSDGSLYSGSNRGPEIALAAPGMTPTSTLLGGGYGTHGSGTSYSAPMVAAALAVLRSANPNLSLAAMLAVLKTTATPVPGFAFGTLQAGKAAAQLVPDLLPGKPQAFASESLSMAYRLPPTGGKVDIYVAVDTPAGSFSLLSDGHWQSVASAGYAPLVSGVSMNGDSGTLFGSGGVFPAIPLTGLPVGDYNWRIAMVDSQRQQLIGPVVATPFQVLSAPQ